MPYQNTTGKALYVNADKSKLVAEDSPEAAFVLAGENGTVSDEDAKKYGLGEHAEGFTPPASAEGQPVPSTAADPADVDEDAAAPAPAKAPAKAAAEGKAVAPKENK